MDEATKEFFYKQQQLDPENRVCIDCGTVSPQWASVSHGCYISLESSGVHRSLGVHISFVRSVTMDSWKPIQLRMMELGGNRKLKEFFRLHDIEDEMPIAQKYNTRAADWYRRNLRALAEGSEPPPPLEEGTGRLPLCDAPSSTQVAFAKSAMTSAGLSSAGGAFSSSMHHYVGSIAGSSADTDAADSAAGGGGSSSSSASAGGTGSPPQGRRPMDGFGSDRIGRGMKMEGFGNEAFEGGSSASTNGHSKEDFLSSIVGDDVSKKVSGKFTASWRAVGNFAGMAKTFAERKVQQAKDEKWLDAALDATKQGVGAAVETTQWAANKGVEAGKATYNYVQESGGGKAFGSTAKNATSLVGGIVDGFSDTLAEARGPQAVTSPGGQVEGQAPIISMSPAPAATQPNKANGDVDSILLSAEGSQQEKARGDNTPLAEEPSTPLDIASPMVGLGTVQKQAFNPFEDDFPVQMAQKPEAAEAFVVEDVHIGEAEQEAQAAEVAEAADAAAAPRESDSPLPVVAAEPQLEVAPVPSSDPTASKPQAKPWNDEGWGDWS